MKSLPLLLYAWLILLAFIGGSILGKVMRYADEQSISLEAQVTYGEEREETVNNLWTLYQHCHCALRDAETHLAVWAPWESDYWPSGGRYAIECPIMEEMIIERD